MDFNVKLAGVTVAVRSLHDEVYTMCREYLTDGEAALTVTVSESDIAFEREKAEREALWERRPVSRYSDAYLETLAVYRKIAVGLLPYGVFLMHGAAVAVGDRAFLFTAPSGTGKTTHTSLWCRHIPGAYIVNGDKPLLRVTEDGCTVCGTPWAGKEGQNTNVEVPLSAVCLLTRGAHNRIEQIGAGEILPVLLGQVYRPADRAALLATMELVKQMTRSVRFYRLACNMDPQAALVAYKGMA